MLRRENDEIQQLKAQVHELAKEVESLKLQLKVFATKAVIADSQMDISENNFAKSIGKVAGNALLGNDIKQYSQNRQIVNQFVRSIGNMLNNNHSAKSFSPTASQNQYQQTQNLMKLSNRI